MFPNFEKYLICYNANSGKMHYWGDNKHSQFYYLWGLEHKCECQEPSLKFEDVFWDFKNNKIYCDEDLMVPLIIK